MKIKYELIKKNKYKKYIEINLKDAFKLNKKIGENNFGVIKFYDRRIVSHIIKKIFDNKFKKLLSFIISVEEGDEDPSEGYFIALNELDKFKKELINKYRKYLQKEQLEFLNKKIELLEIELKNKLLSIQIINNALYNNYNSVNNENYYEDEEEKTSNRRR